MELDFVERNGEKSSVGQNSYDPKVNINGVRKKTSPLPSVPLPPKKLKSPSDATHASCAHVNMISWAEQPKECQGVRRTVSLDVLSSFAPAVTPTLQQVENPPGEVCLYLHIVYLNIFYL